MIDDGTDEDGDGDDFGDFKAKLQSGNITNREDEECKLKSLVPTPYEQSARMEIGGWCGIKYQVTNSNVDAALKFKLLSDNAVTLAA